MKQCRCPLEIGRSERRRCARLSHVSLFPFADNQLFRASWPPRVHPVAGPGVFTTFAAGETRAIGGSETRVIPPSRMLRFRVKMQAVSIFSPLHSPFLSSFPYRRAPSSPSLDASTPRRPISGVSLRYSNGAAHRAVHSGFPGGDSWMGRLCSCTVACPQTGEDGCPGRCWGHNARERIAAGEDDGAARASSLSTTRWPAVFRSRQPRRRPRERKAGLRATRKVGALLGEECVLSPDPWVGCAFYADARSAGVGGDPLVRSAWDVGGGRRAICRVRRMRCGWGTSERPSLAFLWEFFCP